MTAATNIQHLQCKDPTKYSLTLVFQGRKNGLLLKLVFAIFRLLAVTFISPCTEGRPGMFNLLFVAKFIDDPLAGQWTK